MRVVTDAGAMAALVNSPEIAVVSLRVAKAGAEDARQRARVDTGAMRDSIKGFAQKRGRARWGGYNDHITYNEFGTWKMSAQPMIRPSVSAAAAAL